MKYTIKFVLYSMIVRLPSRQYTGFFTHPVSKVHALVYNCCHVNFKCRRWSAKHKRPLEKLVPRKTTNKNGQQKQPRGNCRILTNTQIYLKLTWIVVCN